MSARLFLISGAYVIFVRSFLFLLLPYVPAPNLQRCEPIYVSVVELGLVTVCAGCECSLQICEDCGVIQVVGGGHETSSQ